MDPKPVKIGIVGCGNISDRYLKNATSTAILDTVAVADIDAARADKRAEEFGIPDACAPDELIARDDIEIVVNLTPPAAHEAVNLAALAAGKHVYTEKPLAITREGGRKTLVAAATAGLRVACAPDTMLGGGIQTCRKLIDEGAIGRPVATIAQMLSRGPDAWHPDPEFFYQPGAGPMFDMGPYYLTALTLLLGPVKRLSGAAGKLITDRTVGSGPKKGSKIPVATPDHVTGTMDFASGAVGTIVTSFAADVGYRPRIEVFGDAGAMAVCDPNGFGGPVKLFDHKAKGWVEVPLTHTTYVEGNLRSLGVADLAYAIRTGRKHRCTGEHAYHVLDLMHGFLEAARGGKYYNVPSTFERPVPLPPGELNA